MDLNVGRSGDNHGGAEVGRGKNSKKKKGAAAVAAANVFENGDSARRRRSNGNGANEAARVRNHPSNSDKRGNLEEIREYMPKIPCLK